MGGRGCVFPHRRDQIILVCWFAEGIGHAGQTFVSAWGRILGSQLSQA